MSGDLNDKLAYYERILQQHGLLTGVTGSDIPSVEAPKSQQQPQSNGPHDEPNRVGKLLSGEGTTRYINSNLWRNLGEEEMNRIADDTDDEEAIEATPDERLAGDPMSGAFLGMPQNLLAFHPSTAHAKLLWQTHIENVEPTCKVLHIPTVTAMLQTTSAHPYYASKADECILFAIYHFAIVSLTDDDCQQAFGQQRDILRIQYHNALRQALINASFLRTTQIPVLQAFVLYLVSTRHQNDPHTFWMMTGAAMRISQRMGLHKDGEPLGLPPYDVQIRRRLFYQVMALDGYASQISGTGITIEPGTWDCRQPLNLNDDQIWPGMTKPPEEQKGATEMIFVLARGEFGSWTTRMMNGKTGPLYSAFSWEGCKEGAKLDIVDEMEATIESKYLRYCDILNPLHTLLLIMARSYANAARLRMKLPSLRSNTASDEERRESCTIAARIIDTDSAAYANPSLKRFMWHIKTFFFWDALICMLISMTKPELLTATELENSWCRIERVFNNHGEVLQRNRMLSTSVGRLTLKAWDASPPSFAASGDPAFVKSLRALHAQIEEKRRGRLGRGSTSVASTENATPAADPSPSSDLRAFGQNADAMDFGLGEDFAFDSDDFLFWDQLIQNYRNAPDNQPGSSVQ